MLGEPVQAVLFGFAGAGQRHLRHRHLRHVDDDVELGAFQRDRADLGGRTQIVRRNAHVEEHPAHTVQRVDDVAGTGQVAEDHLGTHRPQLAGALVVAAHHRTHLRAAVKQRLDDTTADAAATAAGSGDQVHGYSARVQTEVAMRSPRSNPPTRCSCTERYDSLVTMSRKAPGVGYSTTMMASHQGFSPSPMTTPGDSPAYRTVP